MAGSGTSLMGSERNAGLITPTESTSGPAAIEAGTPPTEIEAAMPPAAIGGVIGSHSIGTGKPPTEIEAAMPPAVLGHRQTAPPGAEPALIGWPDLYRTLAAAPVFRHLAHAQLLRLSQIARPRQFEPGTALAPEVIADSARTAWGSARVFVVTTGWCTATRSLADGRWAIVGIRGAGQLAGVERLWAGSRPGLQPVATVRRPWPPAGLPAWTAAGWVSVISVPVGELWAAMQISPEARDEADCLAQERIAELETALAERCLETADRLRRTLSRLAVCHGRLTHEGHALDLPLTQTELAGLIGSTRETLNRALRKLAAEGILTMWEGRPVAIRTEVPEQMLVG